MMGMMAMQCGNYCKNIFVGDNYCDVMCRHGGDRFF